LALGMHVERVAQIASFSFAECNAIRHQLVERFEIEPQSTDRRLHCAECDTVSGAILEACQQSSERLYFGPDPLGTLYTLGRCCGRGQRRGGRDDPLRLARHLLRCEGCWHPARCNTIEGLANLTERVDRDTSANHRKTADPEEGQQQSTCHAEPDRHHRASL